MSFSQIRLKPFYFNYFALQLCLIKSNNRLRYFFLAFNPMKQKKQLPLRRNFIFNTFIRQGQIENNIKLQPNQRVITDKIIKKNQSKVNKFSNKLNPGIRSNTVIKTFHSKDKNIQRYNSKNVHVNFAKLVPKQTHLNHLTQSNHCRLTRTSGQKIKIFSAERLKSFSNSSNNSGPKSRKGISLSKALLQKISGLSMHNSSGKPQFLKHKPQDLSTRSLGPDSFHKTLIAGTTWDSQRNSNEQYQLISQYDSNYRKNLDHFGFSSWNTMNNSYETIKKTGLNHQNYQHFGNEPNFQFSRESIQYSKDSIPIFSQNSISIEQRSKRSGPNSNLRKQNRNIFRNYPNQISQYSHRIDQPSFYLNISSKQPAFSSNMQFGPPKPNKILQNSLTKPNFSSKKSLISKKVPQFNPLFQTAHQILSQQTSEYSPYIARTQGQQLTNLIYGNKPQNQDFFPNSLQNHIIFYKNKTLDDLSLKHSLNSNDYQ